MRPSLVLACAFIASGTAAGQSARRIEQVEWKEVGRFEDADGRYLSSPQLIALCGDQLVVADYAAMHVAAFDLGASPRWRFGSKGSGPGEFTRIQSISCDAAGRVWVYDPSNSRVSVISQDGKPAMSIRIERPARRIVVSRDGKRLFGIANRRDALIDVINLDGRVVDTVAAPDAIAKLNVLQREAFITSAADGDPVVAFRWLGAVLRPAANGRKGFSIEGLDKTLPPTVLRDALGDGNFAIRIDPKAPESTQALGVDGDVIYALFAGIPRGSEASIGRIVDRFAATDGRYLGSLRLPFAVDEIAIRGNLAFLLATDPVPAIIILRR